MYNFKIECKEPEITLNIHLHKANSTETLYWQVYQRMDKRYLWFNLLVGEDVIPRSHKIPIENFGITRNVDISIALVDTNRNEKQVALEVQAMQCPDKAIISLSENALINDLRWYIRCKLNFVCFTPERMKDRRVVFVADGRMLDESANVQNKAIRGHKIYILNLMHHWKVCGFD